MSYHDPHLSIPIGVLTRAELYNRRHFLHMVYGMQSTLLAKINVIFAFYSLYKDDQRILGTLEIYDIITLD